MRSDQGCVRNLILTILATVVGTLIFANIWEGSPKPPGLLITSVDPGSPAEAAGLPVGGILESLDGVRLYDIDDLRQVVRTSAGDTLTAKIKYNGGTFTINVTPQRLSSGAGYLGVDVRNLSEGTVP